MANNQRNFTATVKEGLPGQNCSVVFEASHHRIRLEGVGGYDVAKRLADDLNETVVEVRRRWLPAVDCEE